MASAGRFSAPSGPPLPSLAALYSPAALAAAAVAGGAGGCSPPGFNPFSHLPPIGALAPFPGSLPGQLPGGSFQHLLASMTNSSAGPASKVKDITPSSRESPEVASPTAVTPPPSSGAVPPLVERDRRSSSIAALRMRAREYEMKLQLGGKPNGIVY